MTPFISAHKVREDRRDQNDAIRSPPFEDNLTIPDTGLPKQPVCSDKFFGILNVLQMRSTQMNKLPPLIRIIAIKPLNGFKVLLTFANNTQNEVDLEPYLHGEVFESIHKDPEMFRTVKVEGNTIAWSNGADIDPDVLYYDLKPAWMEEEVRT